MLDLKKLKRVLVRASVISIELERTNELCSAILTFYSECHTDGNRFVVPATISDDEIVFAQALCIEWDDGTLISNIINALRGNKHSGLSVDFIRNKSFFDGGSGVDCFRFNSIDNDNRITSQIDYDIFYSPVKQRAIQTHSELPTYLKSKIAPLKKSTRPNFERELCTD